MGDGKKNPGRPWELSAGTMQVVTVVLSGCDGRTEAPPWSAGSSREITISLMVGRDVLGAPGDFLCGARRVQRPRPT
jgi:hypothetical protein